MKLVVFLLDSRKKHTSGECSCDIGSLGLPKINFILLFKQNSVQNIFKDLIKWGMRISTNLSRTPALMIKRRSLISAEYQPSGSNSTV